MMDPSNDGNDLGSTGLSNSLIPVGLVREPTLTMSTYVNDQTDQQPQFILQFVALQRGAH